MWGTAIYGETWGIKKGYIMGKPDTDDVWQQLDDVIGHVYRFKDNKRGLRISITCVDSGGHYTQEVYTRCRERKNQRVFAIKGKGGDGIPFVTPPSKVPIKDNKRITCWLYTLGVDAGKETIMSSLKVQELARNIAISRSTSHVATIPIISTACSPSVWSSRKQSAATSGTG